MDHEKQARSKSNQTKKQKKNIASTKNSTTFFLLFVAVGQASFTVK